jgi:D-alanyl-D-alanine carboxypeptidase (penicillin-binding protein 5/6)
MKQFRKIIIIFFPLFLCVTQVRALNSIIVDNETGCVLEEHGLNSQAPIASLTKLALAVVLLDWVNLCKKNLDQIVEVPSSALPKGPNNPIGLEPGDRLTLRDLLYLSLLISDNQASETIAYYVGSQLPNTQELGPIDNFVSHMNALALELKMKRTLFLNPTGLDKAPSQSQPYSSVGDLARLVRYAYSKPGLSFYVAQKSRDITVNRTLNGASRSFSIRIHNTNLLLGEESIDGVKMGSSNLAGECLVLTSEHHPEVTKVGSTIYTAPRRIIVVLLNAPHCFQQGQVCIEHGWALYDSWARAGRLTTGHEIL